MSNEMEKFLQLNFIKVWHNFLTFDVNRSNFAIETFGSKNTYFNFQVIAWLHVLLTTGESKAEIRDEVLKQWVKLIKIGFKIRTILTYNFILSLNSFSIETVRRQVKKLEQNNWLSNSKKRC